MDRPVVGNVPVPNPRDAGVVKIALARLTGAVEGEQGAA